LYDSIKALGNNDAHEICSLCNAIGVIGEGELGYVGLTHEFRVGRDTFEEHLIEVLTSWVRTITENHHIRLDERARGSAKTAP
jgi:hypothetical protein